MVSEAGRGKFSWRHWGKLIKIAKTLSPDKENLAMDSTPMMSREEFVKVE
jgi:hypothetical protein